jgi:hypothetical protein
MIHVTIEGVKEIKWGKAEKEESDILSQSLKPILLITFLIPST